VPEKLKLRSADGEKVLAEFAGPTERYEPAVTKDVKQGRVSLWGLAGSVGLHLGVAAAIFLGWTGTGQIEEPSQPALSIELAPLPSAPPAQPEQMAPGPQQSQAEQPQETEVEKLKLPPVPVVSTPNAAVVVPKEPERERQPEAKPAPPRPAAPETTAPQSVPAPASEQVGAPALGTPTAGERIAEQTWQGEVLAKIERVKRYPSASQQAKEEDRIRLTVRVDRSGRVVASSIVKSRGLARLDAEALAAVMRASPLPPPPASRLDAKLTFDIFVDFTVPQVRGRRR
jgi:protein TonB